MEKYKCIRKLNFPMYEPLFIENEFYFISNYGLAYDMNENHLGNLTSGEIKQNFISVQEERNLKLEDILN